LGRVELRIRAVKSEDKQEQRAVVMQRKTPEHSTGLIVDNVDIFVPRPISVHLECRYIVAEVRLKAILRTEDQPAHIRMQAISAYHEAKSTPLAVSELNFHSVGMLQERNNFVAENGLGHAFDLVEKQSREIASTERHEPPTGQLPEHTRAKPAIRLPRSSTMRISRM